MATHCAGMYAAVILHLIIRALNCFSWWNFRSADFRFVMLAVPVFEFVLGWWMKLSIRRSILERGTKALLQYLTDKIPA
jgi:hypothetical protein